jgi:hypothetical protein
MDESDGHPCIDYDLEKPGKIIATDLVANE